MDYTNTLTEMVELDDVTEDEAADLEEYFKDMSEDPQEAAHELFTLLLTKGYVEDDAQTIADAFADLTDPDLM